ncbi:hypothetical protein GCM10009133_10770 [Cocleimonas flava]|uniref:Uncharacterized protein n=1 Tax=Cocleimonas flava TaxID=634765 RepID=A0A4R1F6B1_9GAMM|nr:hypothetical protein [Cocleimonas flava]TCJ87438.1 hypothetical protein EV695_1948 [Cocleimonas flava]
MIRIFMQDAYDNSDRIRISKIMCSVAFEHAESLKILLASHNFTSAVGILRIQFESYVRGVWVLYAASDTELSKLTAELNNENAKRAERLPMLSAMINKLESKAPENAISPILEFKKYSWGPLNSYLHGGLHAIDRHSKGYPVGILEQALKASNGVNGMVGMFAAVLTGRQDLVKEVSEIYKSYSDCFQMKADMNS